MSARANLVINDRAGTPVAHTYSPDGDDANGVHIWSEKTNVPAGNPRYTAYIEVSARFDGLSSTQERADCVGLMVNSMAAAQTQINDLLVNLSDVY